MEMKQLYNKQKQLTVGDLWPENKKGLLGRPMSYSDSVKQPKPQGNNERSSPKLLQSSSGNREQIKLNTFERFRKERTKMKKSLDAMEDTYSNQKVNLDKIVSSKKKHLKELTSSINQWFFKDKSVKCKCQKIVHDDQSCFENVSNNIIDSIFTLNASIAEIKSRYNAMKKKNVILSDLLELEFINRRLTMQSGETLERSRKELKDHCIALQEKLDKVKEKLKEARNLQENSGESKQEEFMKNRVKMLMDQVESRVDDMKKIDEELDKARRSYDEKFSILENLHDQCKDIKKELSEAILNRRQFNLCLKENFSYDQRLREVLEERENVQYEYGAVMEGMTAMQTQFDIEEKNKEKFCMSIVALLNEGQQYRIELESIHARVNQMHSEIFVRHCFMHAKEAEIKELTEKCKEFEEKILVNSCTEFSLKTTGEELQRKLTETLFDICFAISWFSVGEKSAAIDAECKEKKLGGTGNARSDSKEPSEYTENIEQESTND